MLVRVRPQVEAQLQREMPVLACFVCGATGAARSCSFARSCGEPGAKSKLAIARLAKCLAPGVSGNVVVTLEQPRGNRPLP